MGSFVVKSYAKINIALNITSKRADGYHELDMVMLPLKLHDSIQIEKLPGKKDNFVIMDDFSVFLGDDNIASHAIDAIDKKVNLKGQKFKVTIHKNIPMQGGMGGGSSNAAATLIGINNFMKLNLSTEELLELSKPLGSDVPFFIYNKPARCLGKGEIIKPINIKNNYHVLIIKPDGGCSTKEIYSKFDEDPKFNICNVDKVVEALETGDDKLLAESAANALQDAAIKHLPEIQTIIDMLKAEGLDIVLMTGSGSTVFAMSTNEKLIKKVAKKYEDKYDLEVTEVIK